jgi:hypothetical protein
MTACEQLKHEYWRILEMILKPEQSGINKIKAVNKYVISLFKYGTYTCLYYCPEASSYI